MKFFFGVIFSSFLLTSIAHAGSYREALRAYADKSYKKSYKIALDRAKQTTGEQEAKALILAGASAWEIDRIGEAQMLFETALKIDPEATLPSVVKKKGLKRAFARARLEPDVWEEEKAAPAPANTAPMIATLIPIPAAPASETENQAPLVASAAPAATTAGSPLIVKAGEPNAFANAATYLPLGLNQLYQNKVFLGLTFGAVQGLALNTAFQRATAAQQANQEAQVLVSNAVQSGTTEDPNFLNYLDQNEAFVKTAQQQAQLAAGIAGLTYLISVLEAGINYRTIIIAETGSETRNDSSSPYKFDLLYEGTKISGISLGMNF